MASHWVKSLQCKSTAFDDVHHPNPTPKPLPPKKPLLPLACSNTQSLKDAVFLQDPMPKRPKRPKPLAPSPSPPAVGPASSFPTLAELPPGHSSRRIVEIIFGSSWGPAAAAFPGRIEMLFRVHNPTRTVARFEKYRSAVRSLPSDDVRCAVDGNEMMRFHCAPPISSPNGEIYDAGVVSLSGGGKNKNKGKGKAEDGIRTFEGSGGAHESAGNGPGRRAMLVSRVIAGRVRSGSDPESSGDSVSAGRGEIVVFDSRAVLPCFLIIYKI